MNSRRDNNEDDSSALEPTIGSWSWDVQQGIVFADPVMASCFGMTAAEAAAGQPASRFLGAIHIEDRDEVERQVKATLAGAPDFSVSYRVRTMSGAWRRVRSRGRVIGPGKLPKLCTGYLIDITGQRASGSVFDEIESHLQRVAALASARQLDMLEHLIAMALEENAEARAEAGERAD